jgi:hypothetical protein
MAANALIGAVICSVLNGSYHWNVHYMYEGNIIMYFSSCEYLKTKKLL